MHRFDKWPLWLIFFLVFCTLWGSIAFQRPALFEKLEMQAFDWHYSGLEYQTDEPEIVLVVAGEETLSRFGKWPWKRRYHAKLLGNLGYARLIITDILFPERSDPADDIALVEVVEKLGNVVMAMHISPGSADISDRVIPPFDELLDACAAAGFTNIEPDKDGLIRYANPLRKAGELIVPSLSLAAVSSLIAKTPEIEEIGDRIYLSLGNRKLPIDSQGRLWLHYTDKPFVIYEYHQVMTGLIPPDTFRDKVVVVGVAASGVEDFYVIPSRGGSRIISGAQLNAEILKTLLSGTVPIRIRPIWDGLITAMLVMVGAGLAVISRPYRGYAYVAGLLVAWAFINHMLFINSQLWIALVIPVIGTLTSFLCAWLLRFKGLQKDWNVKTFSISSIYNLTQKNQTDADSYEKYLESIWPEFAKVTGATLIAPCISREEMINKRLVNLSRARRLSGDKIVLVDDSGKLPRFKLLVPLQKDGTQALMHYTLIGLNRKLADEMIQTLSAMIFSISWFFSLIARNQERKKMLLDTIQAIFRAVDFRDPITGGHSDRVSELSLEIAERLNLDPQTVEDIHLGALIHDIGKIGIPDAVLKKKDALTEEEYLLIRDHPAIDAKIMESVGLPEVTFKALYEHHEAQDGKGYPFGLKGSQISLAARIVAVADHFDALTSERPYRKGMTPDEICDYLYDHIGTQFDPEIVNVLLELKAPPGWKPKHGRENS
jgi:HD-GYP domain-containing protein (c-di-GMP phosphodiesterase class II)/CHASE2 domain-containing sensor protein